jgi:anti-sigma regulatory factor (Ser/Thr protein kinase)
MWTDGLDDLAQTLSASPCAVAYALIRAKQTGADIPWLKRANDDVLVAALGISSSDTVSECSIFHPIVREVYCREQLADIDRIQQIWAQSIALALPELGEEVVHDVLLCAREGLINALKHGCAGGGKSVLQLSACPRQKKLVLEIEDDGPGHHFDTERHELEAAEALHTRHRGLILMRALPRSFSAERNGAKITMEFQE